MAKNMSKDKPIIGWAVMFRKLLPTQHLMDYMFKTKEDAKIFMGKNKADIVKVKIIPIK